MKEKTVIIRECEECGYFDDDKKTFMYLRDGIWSCPNCGGKYTKIKEIIKEK